MDLIRIAIERPTAIISAVIMAVMFGYISLTTIPIQLAPDVNKPQINIRTNWPGAAPAEVEREILNEQEDVLNGLENLESMTGTAQNGRASIQLEFAVGTDMSRALLLVSNRLDRVSSYPPEADQPTLDTAGSEDNPIAWFRLLPADGNERDMHEYGDFAEDFVKSRLERVAGVGGGNVYGGGAEEMQVIIDPVRLAQFELTVTDVVSTLRSANASITGGDVDEGKRRYVIRTDNEFSDLDRVNSVVLRTVTDPATGRIARVTVGDIATVRFGYKESGSHIRSNGQRAIALNATREIGANVIETMAGIREAVEELNTGILPANGLYLEQIYDETVYIDGAINLVTSNIIYGGILAALILMIFLRSIRATLVVALAIPVSVIASFVAMAALGRSLNVVSLAGIAFAVGMVVDAAIVVLENVYRHRQEGKPVREAAYLGAKQVWGAILVSALTTVMVFIPILIMELEVGQLFRDIAVAISVSVLLSLLVSITVIPALSRYLLKGGISDPNNPSFKLPGIDHFGRGFTAVVMQLTRTVVRSKMLAICIVAVLTGATGYTTYKFLPELEYLPEGNRNFIFGILFPPPGYNLDTMREMALRVEDVVRPLWHSNPENQEDRTTLAAADAPLRMENFFFVALTSRTFMGARLVHEQAERVKELMPLMQRPVFQEPGTFGFFTQPSIFGRGVGGSRSIDIDIRGANLEQIVSVAQRTMGMVSRIFPRSEGSQVRPIPGLELGEPEVRVLPDPVRLSDNGVTALELGQTVDAFNDGLRVDEITVGGALMDLTLMGDTTGITETQGIASLPVVTRSGTILPTSSLADVVVTSGPTQIRHTDRVRTITLQLRPRGDMPLGQALTILNEQVLATLTEQGLPPGVLIELSGTADKLQQTWEVMQLDLLLALAIVYLVMAVLFESFLYPLIIVLSVPLATAGGVGGLSILNLYINQPLDMLTLLGFVILIGIVVNNAILIVHQALYHLREEGLAPDDAILEATRNRIRPIFMSTLTSVFGMAPLVLLPGAGSEIYRGLGSVVVGGLSLSAILTLAIIPPLLSLFLGAVEGGGKENEASEKDQRGRTDQVPSAAE